MQFTYFVLQTQICWSSNNLFDSLRKSFLWERKTPTSNLGSFVQSVTKEDEEYISAVSQVNKTRLADLQKICVTLFGWNDVGLKSSFCSLWYGKWKCSCLLSLICGIELLDMCKQLFSCWLQLNQMRLHNWVPI